MVPSERIELPTPTTSPSRSTNELRRHHKNILGGESPITLPNILAGATNYDIAASGSTNRRSSSELRTQTVLMVSRGGSAPPYPVFQTDAITISATDPS